MKRNLSAVISLVLSFVLIGAGAVMLQQGLAAKGQVRDALVAEHITTAGDAEIPDAPVDSAATAKAQADVIQHHTLDRTEGKTYADMDREDPNRDFYLKAVTLRTSLMSAYMGFKVADLVSGLGALLLAVGLGGAAASGLAMKSQPAVQAAADDREKIPA